MNEIQKINDELKFYNNMYGENAMKKDIISSEIKFTVLEILGIEDTAYNLICYRGEDENDFSNLPFKEMLKIKCESSLTELKHVSILYRDKRNLFSCPYGPQKNGETGNKFPVYKIYLGENIYFVIYYDKFLDINECFVYKDIPKTNLKKEIEKNLGQKNYGYYTQPFMLTSPSELSFTFEQIDKIYDFCKKYKIDTGVFFYSFFEYFIDYGDYKSSKDSIECDKIKLWISEIIEPSNPKSVECLFL